MLKVVSAGGPSLVLQRVPQTRGRQVLLDVTKDQEERCEALLPVDELPLAIVAALRDNRL